MEISPATRATVPCLPYRAILNDNVPAVGIHKIDSQVGENDESARFIFKRKMEIHTLGTTTDERNYVRALSI